MEIKQLPDGTPYCEIPLTQGKAALVSPEDYDRVNQFKWFAHYLKVANAFYAQRNISINRTQKTSGMHREILAAPKGMVVDHRDGNGLNNTRANLRLCTRNQNRQNSVKKTKASSRYKGVVYSKQSKKWTASLRFKGKLLFLGYHTDERRAAEAYNEAAINYFGEFAKLNTITE